MLSEGDEAYRLVAVRGLGAGTGMPSTVATLAARSRSTLTRFANMRCRTVGGKLAQFELHSLHDVLLLHRRLPLPFSARAGPGLGVSMPVSWDQLSALMSGAQWTIATAREHLSFQKDDPWKDYWTSKQVMTAAMRRLDPKG